MYRLLVSGVVTLGLLAITCASAATLVPAEDRDAVLHNPDMGWVLYENYPIDQGAASTLATMPDADWSGVDHVAIMFSWADVEREPDVYDLSKVDYAYDWWQQRGKGLQLRMSTASLLWWNNAGRGTGVPQYVLDRMPPEQKQVRQCEGLSYTDVDTRNAYYRERLKRFLQVVAAHFAPDGDRPVSLVDLRGFGLWGEWHTGFQYPSLAERREALEGVLDCWSAAFPQHLLALSYSYDPDSPKSYWDGPTDRYDPAFTSTYQEFLYFSAFDYALTKTNITFRRDGCGGAVHSNERRFCEEAFAAGRGPFMSEFVGGYRAALAAGNAWVTAMVADALSLHPNYVNLLGWQCQDAHDFLVQRPDLIAHGLRTMGYRLVPVRVNCPQRLVPGRPARVTVNWVNRGVGRALRDFAVSFRLTDAEGQHAADSTSTTVPSSTWVQGQTYRVNTTVSFATLPVGKPALWLRLTDPRDNRSIALPLRGGTPDGFYPLGQLP